MNSIIKRRDLGRLLIGLALLASLSMNACKAVAEDDRPTEKKDATPAVAASVVPKSSEPARADKVDQWLDRIEAKADKVKTLEAVLVYTRIQGLKADEQRRFGKLLYVDGPPARFAIHFDKLHIDLGDGDFEMRKQNRWYVFDGLWLVEKLDDQKKFIKRQIAPPPKKGSSASTANPLAEGRGPFILPLNLKKKEITSRFNVKLVKAKKRDPKESIHLHLIPRAPRKYEIEEMDIWYNQSTLLPVRVRSIDESENESIIQLHHHEVNGKIDMSRFNTSEPREKGWEVTVTPWEDKK